MNIRQVRQERDELAVRAEGIVETAIEEKRGLTDEQHAEHKRLLVQIDEHDSLIEAMEENASKSEPPPIRREAIGTQTSGPSIPQEELTGREKFVRWLLGNDNRGFTLGNGLEPQANRSRMSPEQHQRVWERGEQVQRAYFDRDPIQAGMLGGMQQRDLGVGTATAGGHTVDDGMASYIEKAMKQYGQIFSTRAQVIATMTGAPIDYPTVNDTSNTGALLAENTATTDLDLTFANVTLSAYKYTSRSIKVSLELLQDSAFDIEALILDCFAERIGRIVGTHTVTGTGSSQPQGIATAATSGVQLVAGSTAITYANVLALYGSVDPAYDMMAEWAFNKATKVKLLGVLDGDNRPLFRFDMTPDGPAATFMTQPYTVIQEIASQADGAKFMLYGDFMYHKIRQAMAVQFYRQMETHIASAQIGIVGFARYDSRFIDAGAAL